MSDEKTNEILIKLNEVIKKAELAVSSTLKSDIVQNEMINLVEGFFYSTILNNFKSNLTKRALEAYNITKDELNNIEENFKEIFKASEKTIISNPKLGKINSEIYETFRNKLNKISKNAYKLLLELEKIMDISSCEKRISQFKKGIGILGKKLKIKEGELEGGGFGVSIGLEDA